MMKKRNLIIASVIALILVIGGFGLYQLMKDNPEGDKTGSKNEAKELSFEYAFLNEVNKINTNKSYMVSPLSVAYALSMVKEGASGESLTQLENALSGYELFSGINIANRVGIANALFIRNRYKSDISTKYTNEISTKYSADILYDEFKTPKVINDWVKEKTYKMIPSIMEDVSEEFVLGIVNAIAIDIDWQYQFECSSTLKKDFTLVSGQKIDAVMMHESAGKELAYLENDEAKGIIKKYATYDKKTGERVWEETKDTITFEYIAIMPEDINAYLESFSAEKLADLLATKKESSSKLQINLAMPRFKTEYEIASADFKTILNNLGIKDIFNAETADFSKMINSSSELELYIDAAIHKTYIEVNEKGTKAAAVTAMVFEGNMMLPDDTEVINMEFNKPFIYLIKEQNSDNIWFFGTVFEPEIWTKDTITCAEEK